MVELNAQHFQCFDARNDVCEPTPDSSLQSTQLNKSHKVNVPNQVFIRSAVATSPPHSRSSAKPEARTIWDTIDSGCDGLGMVLPKPFEYGADACNLAIATGKGDKAGMAMGAISFIPFGKWLSKAWKARKAAKLAAAGARHADEIAEGAIKAEKALSSGAKLANKLSGSAKKAYDRLSSEVKEDLETLFKYHPEEMEKLMGSLSRDLNEAETGLLVGVFENIAHANTRDMEVFIKSCSSIGLEVMLKLREKFLLNKDVLIAISHGVRERGLDLVVGNLRNNTDNFAAFLLNSQRNGIDLSIAVGRYIKNL